MVGPVTLDDLVDCGTFIFKLRCHSVLPVFQDESVISFKAWIFNVSFLYDFLQLCRDFCLFL